MLELLEGLTKEEYAHALTEILSAGSDPKVKLRRCLAQQRSMGDTCSLCESIAVKWGVVLDEDSIWSCRRCGGVMRLSLVSRWWVTLKCTECNHKATMSLQPNNHYQEIGRKLVEMEEILRKGFKSEDQRS